MELDDLKANWKSESYDAPNPDVRALIGQKKDGPVAMLKKTFKKKLILSAIITCHLGIKNIVSYNNDMLMWVFVIFCGLLTGYYYYSYNLLDDLQSFYKTVNDNIKSQVTILQRGATFYLIILQLLPVVFIALLEIYKQREPFFADWYSQPTYLRVGCYVVLFVLFYFLKKYTHQRNFARHIQYLKVLSDQL